MQKGSGVRSRQSKDSKWYCKKTFKLLTHMDKGADFRLRLIRAFEVMLNNLWEIQPYKRKRRWFATTAILNECISLKHGPKLMHGIRKRKRPHRNRDFVKYWILQQSNRVFQVIFSLKRQWWLMKVNNWAYGFIVFRITYINELMNQLMTRYCKQTHQLSLLV